MRYNLNILLKKSARYFSIVVVFPSPAGNLEFLDQYKTHHFVLNLP
jgi:hypothetical protein